MAIILFLGHSSVFGQQTDSISPRVITLREAVELALKHNHVVRIAEFKVEEKQHAKEVARSAYFPLVRNDSAFVHVTDTQFIEIPAGGLGVVGSTLIPPQPLVLNQGGPTFMTSGTGLVQPLTQLFKVKAGNDAVRAELDETRGKARGVQNEIALKVHQLYYKILIAQSRRSAIEAKILASEDLQSERVQQVKYGNTLEADLMETRAQALQSKQELLSTDLQLSDLRMQFNESVGFPLEKELALDPQVSPPAGSCRRLRSLQLPEQCSVSRPQLRNFRRSSQLRSFRWRQEAGRGART